jgi:hypothetical protein
VGIQAQGLRGIRLFSAEVAVEGWEEEDDMSSEVLSSIDSFPASREFQSFHGSSG